MNWIDISVLSVGVGCTCVFYGYLDKEHKEKTGSHSRQILNTVPTLWTSLGIFGTFLAIYISLKGLHLTSENKTNIVENLINNLVPAFSTSIFGIIGALVTTIYNKWLYNNEDIEDFTKINSPEKNIRAIVSLLKEQQKLSKKYNAQLTTNITTQNEILQNFITDFVDKMGELFETMKNSIDTKVEDFGKEQFNKSSLVLEKISNEMSEASTQLIKNQNSEMKEAMKGTKTELNAISTSLTKMINNISTSNKTALKALTDEHKKGLTTLIKEQKDLSTQLVSDSSKTYTLLQTEMANISSEVATNYKNVINEIKTQNETVAKQINKSLTDTATNIAASVKAECDRLNEAISTTVKGLKESYDFIDERVAQIKEGYNQAVESYKDALKNTNSNSAEIEKTISQMNTTLTAIGTTNENIKNILTLLEDRQTNIDNLVQRIKDVNEAVAALQNIESAFNKLKE